MSAATIWCTILVAMFLFIFVAVKAAPFIFIGVCIAIGFVLFRKIAKRWE
jgi:predicted membrane chloride channel (bestrophin family)